MTLKVVKVRSNNREVVKRLGIRLASTCQISLESQQLQTMGLMPSADIQVIEPRTLGIGEAALISSQLMQSDKKHRFLVMVDGSETIEQRVDRETFEKVLTDGGASVTHNEGELAEEVEKNLEDFQEVIV